MGGRTQQRRDSTLRWRALNGWTCDRSNFRRIELTEIALVDQPPAAVGLEAGVTQPLANVRDAHLSLVLAREVRGDRNQINVDAHARVHDLPRMGHNPAAFYRTDAQTSAEIILMRNPLCGEGFVKCIVPSPKDGEARHGAAAGRSEMTRTFSC